MEEANRVVFLRGKKTILRPPAESDLPRIVRWINDPEVRRLISNIYPQTEEEEKEWLKNLGKKKPSDIVLLIETTEGRPIGLMGIHQVNWVDRTATTGAVLGEKDTWGKGYGSDAKMQLLKYAFDMLNLRKIFSRAIAFNERSVRYSLKCGYEREAVLRERFFRDGRYWDEIILSIGRDGYEAAWARHEQGK
jgi:RimJ/RimL family protein N-acetyltransferase